MSQLIASLALLCQLSNPQVTPDVHQYDVRACVADILDCLNHHAPGPIAYALCIKPTDRPLELKSNGTSTKSTW
jgi:hypothetical protein